MSRQRTSVLARGKWRGILIELGIPEHVLDHCHHPCPTNRAGKDRFRFSERERFFCACSYGGDGFDLLKCYKDWSFEEAAREVDLVVNNVECEQPKPPMDARPALEKLWRETTAPGNEVNSYLRNRGLVTPPYIRQVVREYWQKKEGGYIRCGKYHCMVAQIKNRIGDTVSLHVTYIDNGKKAKVDFPRKIMSPISTINGAAIRLYDYRPGDALGIAEGIETAIAAGILHNMCVWSVSNRNGIETFEPPDGVGRIHIFGDVDDSYAGQAGAYRGAERLVKLGHVVTVNFPKSGDYNDVLLQKTGDINS